MAISRATKTQKIEMLTKELSTSTSAIIGTFAGLTASKDFELRKTVRAAGASYHVVKNKLAAKASQGSKIEQALQGLKGVSAVAYTSGDPVELAKALSTWVKDNSEFTFKLAIVDGQLLNVQQISELATMPGKEELFSKLLFLIQSPAQRLATVLNATGRDLAVVLGQGVEKEKFAAGAAPAAPAAAAAPVAEASAAEAPVAEAPAAEAAAPVTEAAAPVEEAAASVEQAAAPVEAAAEPEATAAEPEIAAAHAEEAPTPTEEAQAAAPEVASPEEMIAANPAAEADPVAAEAAPASEEPAQPENGTASQAGEAANTDPVEG